MHNTQATLLMPKYFVWEIRLIKIRWVVLSRQNFYLIPPLKNLRGRERLLHELVEKI